MMSCNINFYTCRLYFVRGVEFVLYERTSLLLVAVKENKTESNEPIIKF